MFLCRPEGLRPKQMQNRRRCSEKFGTTLKLHWGVDSVVFPLVKSILTGVPQGEIDRRYAHRGDHDSKTNYPHLSHSDRVSLNTTPDVNLFLL